MRIAIIDADLTGRKKHRFPNLACMKISAYHKAAGDDAELKVSYTDLSLYDRVYISKVFTDTPVPPDVLQMKNVVYGGTGFYYDKAPPLPVEIEHQMPDYHLYDEWVNAQMESGGKQSAFKYYTDYSIGFITRGCFRKCAFCVNRNYDRAVLHGSISEFLSPERKKICLLDDNFLASSRWKEMLAELRCSGKPFQFKQGLDIRLLTEEKCAAIFSCRYDGDYIFAFDNVDDVELIEERIRLVRSHTKAVLKFYCFCGFDRNDRWDAAFWQQDILDLFLRIEVLMKHGCIPYVMRFARYEESPHRGLYITIARWCNQPGFFKKRSLREFAQSNGLRSASYRYLLEFEKKCPDAAHYYDLKYEEMIRRSTWHEELIRSQGCMSRPSAM